MNIHSQETLPLTACQAPFSGVNKRAGRPGRTASRSRRPWCCSSTGPANRGKRGTCLRMP